MAKNDATQFASLTGAFIGWYIPVIGARDQLEARLMLNSDRKTKSLWCDVYTREQVEAQIAEYGGKGILEDFQELDYDYHFVKTTHEAMTK